jgi:hypothetical protein
MVSTWWLLGSFLAGGYAGLLLFALLNISRDTSDDAHPMIARSHRGPRPEVNDAHSGA